jgi:hypothetical protein
MNLHVERKQIPRIVVTITSRPKKYGRIFRKAQWRLRRLTMLISERCG